jgi:hypothetical protein
VSKFSDFEKVKKRGKEYGLEVFISDRDKKKYMIKRDNKKIHFGQMEYEDFTKTNDETKRKNFRSRNRAWKNAGKFTPAWLSYHLLW